MMKPFRKMGQIVHTRAELGRKGPTQTSPNKFAPTNSLAQVKSPSSRKWRSNLAVIHLYITIHLPSLARDQQVTSAIRSSIPA